MKFTLAGSHLALPYITTCTLQSLAQHRGHPPVRTTTSPPCAQFWHPALLSCRRSTLCKEPSSLWSRLGCNSKRSCAINASWQEKHCTACCSSSCHTSLPSLPPPSLWPCYTSREERKSKAVLKPSLSSSLFIHCAEWYSEKLH